MKKRRGQMFIVEFGLAVLIFAAAMGLYYRYVSDSGQVDSDRIAELMKNAKDISETLLSSGYPDSWNSSNVQRIGITQNDNRINSTKLLSFKDVDYEESRLLLATPYQYYVFFKDRNGNIVKVNSSLEGIGFEGINSTNIKEVKDIKSLAIVERIVILNSDLGKMVLYVWRT
jgi:hypothetical protein